MHRKTAFIQNRLTEAVADAIADPNGVGQVEPMPAYLDGPPKVKKTPAAKKPVKKRTKAKAKKRA